MKKYWAEFLGTFMMVFAGTGAIIINDLYGSVSHLGIGLTFGTGGAGAGVYTKAMIQGDFTGGLIFKF